MTILELIQKSTDHLKSEGFNNSKTSCEILLAHTLGMKRLDLYLNYDRPVSDDEREQFRELYRRRLENEPLSYIIGETEFMSLSFQVNSSVLIPRPETEFVVEEMLKKAKYLWGGEHVTALDIGTGSGCVAVSLAHYLPSSSVTALDVSSEALEVARINAEKNEKSEQLIFKEADIFECSVDEFKSLNIVFSNPPYVLEGEKETLEKDVVDHEPHVALFAGDDGLKFYRKITELAQSWLQSGGLLVFETGYNTGKQAKEIVENGGFKNVELHQDYAGHDRLIMAEK